MKNNNILILSLLTIFFTVTTCSKDTDEIIVERENPCKDQSHSNPAANNNLFKWHKSFGENDEQYQIWEVLPTDDGHFYFRGFFNDKVVAYTIIVGADGGILSSSQSEELDGEYVIGKMTINGQIIWLQKLDFRPRDILSISIADAEVQNGLMTVGKEDIFGKVLIHDKNGNRRLEYASEVPSWFNGVELLSDEDTQAQFVAAGGSLFDNSPLLLKFSYDKISDTIAFTQLIGLGDAFEGQIFDLKKNGNNQLGVAMALPGISGIYFTVIEADFASRTEITQIFSGAGIYLSSGRGVAADGNDFYLCFSAEDSDKEETVDGDQWDSGYLVKLNYLGQREWGYKYPVSNRSDLFFDIELSEDKIYAIGRHAAECYNEKRCCFSNAMIYVIEASTGNGINVFTFNESGLSDNFYGGFRYGDEFFAYGKLNESRTDTSFHTFQGWIGAINYDDLQR